jgi:hypothetical protein
MAHLPRLAQGAGEPNSEIVTRRRVPPNAPAGDGGPGHFRDADAFRADEEPDETVRHSKTPVVRAFAPDAAAQPTSGPAGGVTRQPPPKTTTLDTVLATQSGPEVNMEVHMLVLVDQMNDDTVPSKASAETRILLSPGLERIEGAEWETMNGKITKVTKKLIVRGTFSIQTSYRPGADPNHDSKYGRGTTAADKASGNVTLGFHESCHRDEYIAYLTSTPFPKFNGKIGMSEKEFKAASKEFNDAFKAFGAGYRKLGAAVDEVGDCKQSDWQAGRCK